MTLDGLVENDAVFTPVSSASTSGLAIGSDGSSVTHHTASCAAIGSGRWAAMLRMTMGSGSLATPLNETGTE